MQLLQEYLAPSVANLTEMKKTDGQMYMSGISLMANVKNGNGRTYSLNEITKAAEDCQKRAAAGNYILGELNHPEGLSVDLKNASHSIVEMRMDGNNAIGKMKILNTPSGNIVRGITEGGVRLGVSSRGTGNVNESGEVSGFDMVTIDIVYQPSAPDAFPNVVYEALGNKKVMTLAEAVTHDPKAQDYFKKEMKTFLESIFKGKK